MGSGFLRRCIVAVPDARRRPTICAFRSRLCGIPPGSPTRSSLLQTTPIPVLIDEDAGSLLEASRSGTSRPSRRHMLRATATAARIRHFVTDAEAQWPNGADDRHRLPPDPLVGEVGHLPEHLQRIGTWARYRGSFVNGHRRHLHGGWSASAEAVENARRVGFALALARPLERSTSGRCRVDSGDLDAEQFPVSNSVEGRVCRVDSYPQRLPHAGMLMPSSLDHCSKARSEERAT